MAEGGPKHNRRTPAPARAEIPCDADLVKRAQGELPYVTDALELLLLRYNSLLYRTCRRILGNDTDAEDATQETMIKVFHHLKGFEGRSSFKTWFFRIAHNVCYTRYQQRVQQERTLADYGHAAGLTTEQNMAALDVDRLLARLSALDREVLTLRFVADLNIEEIADVLG
ncbi:MAG: sigma-70 family RNA polymerase sigma factor, partial [Burkholderiales bacterium]|nr:sigma-70 family RNA polymerase sigma factor [Burkholderiales bacterium]